MRLASKSGFGFGLRTRRWKERKRELATLKETGENWAIEELARMLEEEKLERKVWRENFRAKRTVEELREYWARQKAKDRAKKAKAAAGKEKERRRLEREGRKKAKEEKAARLAAELALKRTEREVVVWRVPANPRVLVCRFEEGVEERQIVVEVAAGTNAKFVAGMVIRVVEHGAGAKWEYRGELPKRRGVW